jgi:hypothetical protein
MAAQEMSAQAAQMLKISRSRRPDRFIFGYYRAIPPLPCLGCV